MEGVATASTVVMGFFFLEIRGLCLLILGLSLGCAVGTTGRPNLWHPLGDLVIPVQGPS